MGIITIKPAQLNQEGAKLVITKLTRWLLPSLLAIVATFTLLTPVLAITPPDNIEINDVWVYRNCRETGDQLYIVDYNIDYPVLPDETATQAYICRLMDGDDTLENAYPYSYHDKGYGRGVVAIYFDAGDAPTWEGGYVMELLGSPFVDWTGALPEDTMVSSSFSLWQDNESSIQKVVIASRIMYLANELEADWGVTMTSVSDTGEDVLSSYGVGYFVNVIPYLSDIALSVYPEGTSPGTSIVEPEIPPDTSGQGYAEWLVDNIIGTPLDLTPVADILHVSRGALTALLYYGLVAFVVITASRKLGSYRPLLAFSIPLVIFGAFVGVPLQITILAGLAALAMTGWALFYKPSPA